MDKKLLFSVSGLRGIVNESLDIPAVVKYTEAFIRYTNGDVYAVAQDTRPHSLAIRKAVISTILACGKEVIDLGVVPTPTLLYFVRTKRLSGGIMITASHNPIEWNALKFVNSHGMFIDANDVKKIEEIANSKPKWCKFWEFKPLRTNTNAINDHINAILEHPLVKVKEIRRKGFTVVCDCINGAAYEAIPLLLEKLGCRVVKLNCDDSGDFVRNPEPKKEYLGELEDLLFSEDADVAFATDPDGDRLVVGVRNIGILSEEYTVPLAAYHVLNYKKGDIVVNFSTSMMIEDIARIFKVNVHRSPVGEANVVSLIKEKNAVFGGEGNGGVIFPEINPARDSLTGIALILSLMAEDEINEVLSKIPKYFMVKKRIEWNGELPQQKLKAEFKNFDFNELDGIYFRRRKEWVHIRKSNTEPIVRIYAEAESEGDALKLVARALKVFE
ncbi:MAG: phosphoglucosamine mutase [Candidatus Hydrothermia bacterium]